MTRTTLFLSLMVMLPAIGCPDDTEMLPDSGDTDAGGADAGDTDAGDTDAGDTDAGDTDGGDDDVARCQAASAALAAICPSDGDRTCHVGEYGDFCSADARAGLYADALDCLLDMSGPGGCRTFSDPSGADTCIDAVYVGVTSAEVDAVVGRLTNLCAGDPLPQRTEPPLFALTPTQLAALQTCLDAAIDCAGAGRCADTASGDIAVCYM